MEGPTGRRRGRKLRQPVASAVVHAREQRGKGRRQYRGYGRFVATPGNVAKSTYR